MKLFLQMMPQMAPLFFQIIIGFIAGRIFHIGKQDISKLLLYIILPILIFETIINANLSGATIALPLAVLGISTLTAGVTYLLGRRFWRDSNVNILALSGASSNTILFGIPVSIIMLNKITLPVYIIAMMGTILFQYTLGIFLAARTEIKPLKAIGEILKQPILYAFALGIFFNKNSIPLPQSLNLFILQMHGACTVTSMIIIGLGLSSIKLSTVDFKFIGMAFIAKFILCPLIALLFIYIDLHHLHILKVESHQVIMFISVMPIAASNIVFSSIYQTHTEKASSVVLLSTIFSLFYIPLIYSIV